MVTASASGEAGHILLSYSEAGGRDEPSSVIADRLLSSLSPLRSKSQQPAPGSEQALVALLGKWLPQGPVSGASPVAAIAEEEVRSEADGGLNLIS